jgi:hypothetical protein
VRLSSGGNVYYARTFNWSRTSVQTGSDVVSTDVDIPVTIPAGFYNLAVVANGIASDPITYYAPIWVDFTYFSSFGFYFGTYVFPYRFLADGVSAVAIGGSVYIKNGSHSPETMTISKPMTIRAYGLPTTIGQ